MLLVYGFLFCIALFIKICLEIVDGNLKMILSLIWALIFHFQLQVWVDGKDKQTAKGSLLNWVRDAVLNVGVSSSYLFIFHIHLTAISYPH